MNSDKQQNTKTHGPLSVGEMWFCIHDIGHTSYRLARECRSHRALYSAALAPATDVKPQEKP